MWGGECVCGVVTFVCVCVFVVMYVKSCPLMLAYLDTYARDSEIYD